MFYIEDGMIKLAATPDQLVGKNVLSEPFNSIYGFLQSRKEYLETTNTTHPDVLHENKIYLAHIEHLIFGNNEKGSQK
jgi:hypothetical protein